MIGKNGKMEQMESEVEALFSGDDDTLLFQLTSLNISMISQSMAKDNWINMLERKQHKRTLQTDGAKITIETAWEIVEEQRSEIKALKAQLGSQACVSQRPIGNSMMKDRDSSVMESNSNSKMIQLDLQARIVQSSIGNSIFENSDDNELFEKLFSQLDEKNKAIEALQKEVDYLRKNKAPNDHATEASLANNSDATDSGYSGYATDSDYLDYADDQSDHSDVTADANDYSDDFDSSNPCGFDPDAFPDIGPFAILFCDDTKKSSEPKQQHRVQNTYQDLETSIGHYLEQIKILATNDISTEDYIEATHRLNQMIVDQHTKDLVLKNENIGLRDRVIALENELNELRRHKIYRFWTEDGKGLYTGQNTMGGKDRISEHLNGTGVFGKKLAEWFDDGKKCYVTTIKEGLTELEANDFERALIMADKQDESNTVCCNEERGRMTKRFSMLSPEEQRTEIQKASALAAAVFERLTPDKLISAENIKEYVVQKCIICYTEFEFFRGYQRCSNCESAVKLGDCTRCTKKGVGIDNYGQCRNCHRNKTKAIEAGVKQKPFKPSNARTNNKYDNQAQKALAYSIYKFGVTTKTAIAQKIQFLFDKDFATCNAQNWSDKFKAENGGKSTFDTNALKDFLEIKKGDNKYKMLSETSITALVIYEFDRKQSVVDAATRINTLFNVSLRKPVTSQQVQTIFDELNARKASLKRKGQDNPSSSGDKRSKLN